MVNLAGSVGWGQTLALLRVQLFERLRRTQDPREVAGGTVEWDYYPYYGIIKTEGWRVDEKRP